MPDRISYIPRMINFSSKEFNIVSLVVRDKGLGGKGFSAAVRLIINEWYQLTHQGNPSSGNAEASASAKASEGSQINEWYQLTHQDTPSSGNAESPVSATASPATAFEGSQYTDTPPVA